MDYGEGPALDEPEIVVFGPGYGEAIAVHLGAGEWLLIDSCLNPSSCEPAALEYLGAIGVRVEQVIGIVASHWHDDHVRGISTLVEKCNRAELFISGVFNEREARAFLAAYSGDATNGLNRGTHELLRSVQAAQQGVVPTVHRLEIVERTAHRPVKVSALSPTTQGQRRALEHFASFIPGLTAPINNAPDLKPNTESVVVHIDLGDDAILLGSDLEHDAEAGWEGIVESAFGRSRQRASVYKVAHHGSITAEYPGIWSVMLVDGPTSVMTPFVKGKVKLPNDADRVRIREQSAEAYITSGASRKTTLDREIEKRLKTLCTNVTPVNNGFGAVRLRRSNGTWSCKLIGDATRV